MNAEPSFAVVGAGAIGAYIGAALARGGSRVVLIARGAHLAAMQRDGVSVLSPRGDFHVHVPATDDLSAAADADIVFLAVKAHSLPGLAPALGEVLAPETAVVAAQNGIPWWYFQADGPLHGTTLQSVDPGGVIATSIELPRVIGCVVYASTEIKSPGVIRHVEGTRFTIGEPDKTASERCRLISEALVAGGLKCPVETDLRGQIWLKLIGNAAFNPITALTGATLGQLGEVAEMRMLLRALLTEGASVAQALGVEMPVSLERRMEAGIQVGDHKTSMLQDLEAGRALEFECMTGAICEIAHHLGTPVPHMEAIHASVKLLDLLRVRRHEGNQLSMGVQ